MTRLRSSALVALALLPLAALACGNDQEPTLSGVPISGATTVGTEALAPPVADIVAGDPIPDDRCAANRAAGTITFLSSFDFAATASIVDVLVADERGYFDELCLDVELVPSFSTQNYPLIAANDAQFSSGGSFSEVIDFGGRNEAEFRVMSVEGRTGIDGLIVKDGLATTLEDLRGTTIGVKGKITPSVAAMLAAAGLREGTDYQTVLLEGFDPKVHIEVPNIVGFPGYKSNEPLQLAAAGIPFTLFDPSEFDIPGSFGIIYTNATFAGLHPSATEDFMRATMRGLADAIADPVAAAEIAIDRINAGGNAMSLSAEGETARWKVESGIIADGAELGPLGAPLMDLLDAEVTSYADIGLFDGEVPDLSTVVDDETVRSLYAADGSLIWPRS
jgi:ABC-type nitrate/sulfonate/bicarbonate transport system substrate-binding protein